MVTFLKMADGPVQTPPPTPVSDNAVLPEKVELTTCKVESGPPTLMPLQLGAKLAETVVFLIRRCPRWMLTPAPPAIAQLLVMWTRSSSRVQLYPAMTPPVFSTTGPKNVPPPSPPVSVTSVIVTLPVLRKNIRLIPGPASMVNIDRKSVV